jgi:hypothetical protein
MHLNEIVPYACHQPVAYVVHLDANEMTLAVIEKSRTSRLNASAAPNLRKDFFGRVYCDLDFNAAPCEGLLCLTEVRVWLPDPSDQRNEGFAHSILYCKYRHYFIPYTLLVVARRTACLQRLKADPMQNVPIVSLGCA